MANEPILALKTGDPAPLFKAQTSGGGTVSLAEFKGRQVILYFYPRDNTSGCTREACGFRDAHTRIEANRAVVLGVSTDSVKSHDKFIEKFRLPFLLLADENKEIAKAYGAWGKKKFMGREYDGIYRVTFLIGPEGKIKKVWPVVKPETHAAEVLAALAK
jgi:peroxiredoxin Q/BCP